MAHGKVSVVLLIKSISTYTLSHVSSACHVAIGEHSPQTVDLGCDQKYTAAKLVTFRKKSASYQNLIGTAICPNRLMMKIGETLLSPNRADPIWYRHLRGKEIPEETFPKRQNERPLLI